MKKLYVIGCSLMIFSACSKTQITDSASTEIESLSKKLSASMVSDLKTSTNNTTTNKINGYPFFLKADLQTMEATYTLSAAETTQIEAAINTEVAAQNLSNSSELNTVLPAIIAGAETALSTFTDKTATEKLAIMTTISTSAVTAVSTFNSYAIDNADSDNASKESEILKQISETIVGRAGHAGFTSSDIANLSETITANIVKNIDKAGITSDKVEESIKLTAAGAVRGINTISGSNMTGFDITAAQNAMTSITSGAIASFGDIKTVTSGTLVPDMVKNFTSHMTSSINLLSNISNLNVNTAEDFIKNISSGATKGIGSISRTDMNINDLPNLAKQVSEGAVQGLNDISITGFTSTQLPAYVKKVAEGSVGGLSQITHTDYDSDKYASMIENINSGATKALASITMTGYSADMLPSLAENIAAGSTGVLGTLLEGKNPSLLTTMVSSISKGSTAALEDLSAAGELNLSNIPDMAKSITKGSTQALQNITMTGYTSTIMEGMVSSISQGAAAGFASYTIPGFNSANMTTVMSSISAGATEGINNFTNITNISSGTFNPSTALTYLASGLSTAAGDMTTKYNISSASLTSAITSGMNTGISSTGGTLAVPSDLSTTITSGFTAGPMIYNAFFQDNDTDSDQISGFISISRAMNEENVTSYRIYYGSDPYTKSGAALTEIQKSSLSSTMMNFTYEVAANTVRPQDVQYFLIYTVLDTSESSKGFAVPIYDYAMTSYITTGSTSTNISTGSYTMPTYTTTGSSTYTTTGSSTYTTTGTNNQSSPGITYTPTAYAPPDTTALVLPSVSSILNGDEIFDTQCRLGGYVTISINNMSATPIICPSSGADAGHIKIPVSSLPGFSLVTAGCSQSNCTNFGIMVNHASIEGLTPVSTTYMMRK